MISFMAGGGIPSSLKQAAKISKCLGKQARVCGQWEGLWFAHPGPDWDIISLERLGVQRPLCCLSEDSDGELFALQVGYSCDDCRDDGGRSLGRMACGEDQKGCSGAQHPL